MAAVSLLMGESTLRINSSNSRKDMRSVAEVTMRIIEDICSEFLNKSVKSEQVLIYPCVAPFMITGNVW